MMRSRATAIAATVLLAVLAGCGGGESGDRAESEPTGVNAPTTDAIESPEPEPSEAPSQPGVLGFGESFTYEDGLVVSVSGPEPFTPSAVAAVSDEFSSFVTFTVRYENRTAGPFDPNLSSVSAQSGHGEAEQVYDVDNGLDGPPSTALLPGRDVEFKVGFGVADPQDVVVQVAPSFDHRPVVFTGAGS